MDWAPSSLRMTHPRGPRRDRAAGHSHRAEPMVPASRWSNQIRTEGPIRVFCDRGGGFENPDGIAAVDIGAFADDPPHAPRGQYRRHQYRLERLSALVLNDHAYDKLTGWSNVISVVPVKGGSTATYKFIKEQGHGTRSTPHRHRT